jgi:hypothetical protein
MKTVLSALGHDVDKNAENGLVKMAQAKNKK